MFTDAVRSTAIGSSSSDRGAEGVSGLVFFVHGRSAIGDAAGISWTTSPASAGPGCVSRFGQAPIRDTPPCSIGWPTLPEGRNAPSSLITRRPARRFARRSCGVGAWLHLMRLCSAGRSGAGPGPCGAALAAAAASLSTFPKRSIGTRSATFSRQERSFFSIRPLPTIAIRAGISKRARRAPAGFLRSWIFSPGSCLWPSSQRTQRLWVINALSTTNRGFFKQKLLTSVQIDI